MIKKEIFITGLNLHSSLSPEDIMEETLAEVSFTEADNDMVLNIMIPLSIVKDMNLNGKYELIINKLE